MRFRVVFFALIPFLTTAGTPHSGAALAVHTSQIALPLRFEKNLGQAGPGVRYIAPVRGHRVLFADRELRLGNGVMRFAGASDTTHLEALDPMVTRVNYYTGGPAHWATDVPCWSRIAYRDVYPGIDLLFYGQAGVMEYDALVAPGADPWRVRFRFDGGVQPQLDSSGDLHISMPEGSLIWHRPVAYQPIAGKRVPVDARFVLRGAEVSFRLGKWDRAYELVIDPTLSFSTFLGSSGNDLARGIAVDAAGNVYVAGAAGAGDLAGISAGSWQSDYTGDTSGSPQDAFLAKLNPAGTAVLYATYLGGTGRQQGWAVAIDGSGNAYIAGNTTASDFPVTAGAYQTSFGGLGPLPGTQVYLHSVGDAFVAKFSPSGQRIWATYLGGSLDDAADAIAVDSAGDVYVAGATVSSNFPVTGGAFQRAFHGGGGQPTIAQTGYVTVDTGDGFISELDSTGQHLLASTYLGGSLDDAILTLTLDSKENVWVAGATVSTNFPLAGNPLQKQFGGESSNAVQLIFNAGDGFISELNSSLTTLSYSTYLGGSADDAVGAIGVDSSGAVYVAGATDSPNFPVTNGTFRSVTPSGPISIEDAFVAKLQPGASSLTWSTILAGGGGDAALSLALDGRGNVDVGGMTDSTNFPVTAGALKTTLGGANTFAGLSPYSFGNGFITQLSAASGVPSYSTYLGGSGGDAVLGLAVDASGNIFTTGFTASPDFPSTTGVVQPALKTKMPDTTDAFVTKLAVVPAAVSVTSVKNAASGASGSYSPGEYVLISGTNLGPSSGVEGEVSDGRLSTNTGGVEVMVNGVPAPLGYVSATEIYAVIPYQAASSKSANLVVSYNGATSANFPLSIVATAPGLFTTNGQGSGQAVVLNSASGKTSVNSSSSPAGAGDVLLIFGTGEGALKPAGVTGQVTGGTGPSIAAAVSVRIGTVTVPAADIQYAGEVADTVEGVFELKVVVPAGVSAGNDPLRVTIGGVATQAGVTLAIR